MQAEASIVIKTVGLGDVIRAALAGNPNIESAFIYGSYASGEADEQSDLDLMVMGQVVLSDFAPVIAKLENTLHRPVNYGVYTQEEWQLKLIHGDAFALNVKDSPKIFLIGSEDAV
jgi:predicted nucleotidyltransferase